MTSLPKKQRFRPGDLVEVRTPAEIARTMDEARTVDGLPFMPEMVPFCGKRFRVTKRVVQAVIDGAALSQYAESYVREFRGDDVVLLEGLRCSGASHDDCQRGCMLFWKEAWLQHADPAATAAADTGAVSGEKITCETVKSPGVYRCQSTEFRSATLPVSFAKRMGNLFRTIFVGNYGPLEMIGKTAVWAWCRGRTRLIGAWPRGRQTSTPTESLGLRAGDWVEVKTIEEIRQTLDNHGKNRGLHFSADMVPYCGLRLQVRSRADNFITEATGVMRHFKNTVILETAISNSAIYAFGGCPRGDFLYWREIWLRRVSSLSHNG